MIALPHPPSGEDVLPYEPRPLNPAYPLQGCCQHGTYYWQRGCPGCPDPEVYAEAYARLDAYMADLTRLGLNRPLGGFTDGEARDAEADARAELIADGDLR